jgi:hypothetical protein
MPETLPPEVYRVLIAVRDEANFRPSADRLAQIDADFYIFISWQSCLIML